MLKRCRCSPSCHKWLRERTRRKHYSTVDPEGLLSSDLGSDSDVGMQDESDEEDPDESLDNSESGEAGSITSAQLAGPVEMRDEDEVSSVVSDVGSVQSEEGDSDELTYHEEEELADKELADIIEHLRDWHGPGKEERVHQIRAYLSQPMVSLLIG